MSVGPVLVTGVTGFVGGAAARALVSRGLPVHGTTASGRSPPQGVVLHRCDLLAPEAAARLIAELRPTHLLHAAWDVTHGAYWASSANLAWLAASANLVRLFREAGGRRAVGVGTCAEYRWTEARYDEVTSPLEPATVYGRCKLALHHVFAAGAGLGLSTAWARLFFPYGPGESPQRFIPSLVDHLASGRPFAMTDGTQCRDFIHIDDVGEALARLVLSDVAGPVNLGSGEGVSLRDVAITCADLIGADLSLLRFGALPSRPGDPPSLVARIDRLRNELGFVPQISWRNGLARTIAALRARREPWQG